MYSLQVTLKNSLLEDQLTAVQNQRKRPCCVLMNTVSLLCVDYIIHVR